MNKISLYNDPVEIATIMSEGNPGALRVVMELMKTPIDCLYLLSLDTIGIYGSEIYILWNDCCGRDFDKLKTVLNAWKRGQLTAAEIRLHVSGGHGTPFVLFGLPEGTLRF